MKDQVPAKGLEMSKRIKMSKGLLDFLLTQEDGSESCYSVKGNSGSLHLTDFVWCQAERMDGRRRNLEPPSTFGMLQSSGLGGLIPPSHFQTRPLPGMSRMTSVQSPPLPLILPSSHHSNHNHRWENHRLQILRQQDGAGDSEEPKRRGRSLDHVGPQHMRSQTEIISQHLEEMRRLEMESQALRVASAHQKAQLATQAEELEVLGQAEQAMRVEVEELRTALAGAELIRQKLEEANKRELEETQKLHKEQISHMTAAHQEVLNTLANKAHELEEKLKAMESKREEDTKELTLVQREATMLREELSKAHAELETQMALVEQLRRYIGDQFPSENKNLIWEQERKQLLETVQHLQEDRDTLCATLELLQVRVQSLQDILALQEEELGQKVQPTDPLQSEEAKKAQAMLSRWREKVFALMVQLKAQELEHTQHTQKLKGKVAELEGEVASRNQESAILHRSLQDKAAEAGVEKANSKMLQGELIRAQDARLWQQQQTKVAEEHVKLVAHAVNSSHNWLQNRVAKVEEAVSQLPRLNNRLGYATRQIRTIQGLVARKIALAQLHQEQSSPAPLSEEMGLELQQLKEERKRLDEELQLSARLIQQEVGRAREQGEAERIRLNEEARQLEQELQKTQESLAEVGIQLQAARMSQKESTEEAACLRRELTQQQEAYGRALQDKVAEVETRLREQLSEMERRLNEARREHAKAVVSLRQAQRQAVRDKERNQELGRLQEEAQREEGVRLRQRLQELERDKNLMLATLKQEGLLSQYKQQRLFAILPSPSLEPSPGTSGTLLPTRELLKGSSLSDLLEDLQEMSEVITREEEEGDNGRCSVVSRATMTKPYF
ncbi:coiled-coil alpha-helical rod protein 1 isoform X2 [Monodelphis domestica]|uniref:coiled-coil alpha-helical rod protein 1 isoform X2 n=1 Tax=Monodelphis domestica TaxID=13616 RepID=UPI0004433278|nr:coiled-coil alpha-helical rod protein 1 isoform X2 [Monodelphis domestica]